MSEEYSGRTIVYQGHAYRVSPEVQLFLEKGQKIQVIKQLRKEYALGLKEAKGVADLIDFEFKFSTKAKTGWTLQDKLEARKKETEKSKGDVGTLLLRGIQSLIGAVASIESRIEALEKIDVKRDIKTRVDGLANYLHEIEGRLETIEKKKLRRVILRKKEE